MKWSLSFTAERAQDPKSLEKQWEKSTSARRNDKPKEKESAVGQVSHFQALTTALSGTVGLGNISGVAIAIAAGGPGATFLGCTAVPGAA